MSLEHIFYVAPFRLKQIFESVFASARSKLGQAAIKFYRFLAEEFVHNGRGVHTFSCFPVTRSSHSKVFWLNTSDCEDRVRYTYILFLNVSLIRNICLVLGLFLFLFIRLLTFKVSRKKVVVLLDTLISNTKIITSLACWLSLTKMVRMTRLIVYCAEPPKWLKGLTWLQTKGYLQAMPLCFLSKKMS